VALECPIELDRTLRNTKGFSGILGGATLLGIGLNFIGVNPIKALSWSAVINGVAAVPIMIVMMLMTTNEKITGSVRLLLPQKVIGWIASAVMVVVATSMIVTLR
jgi:Mn2+/Fe2+ NRAMP family transporter